MNRIYTSVFNKRSGLWQVASELTTNVGKAGGTLLKPGSATAIGFVTLLFVSSSAQGQTIYQTFADFYVMSGGAALAGGTAGGKGGVGGGGGAGSASGVGGAGGNTWGGLGGQINASGNDAVQANSSDPRAQMLFVGLSGGGGGSATPSATGNNAVANTGGINDVLSDTGARHTIVLGGAGGGAGAGTAGYKGGYGETGQDGSLIFQTYINSLTVNNLFIGGDGGSAASYLSGKAGNGGIGHLYLSKETVDAGTITVGGAPGLGDSSQAGAGGSGFLIIDGASSVTTTGGILVRDTGTIDIRHSVGIVLLNTDISGAGAYTQTGGGTTILTGADSRTGSTSVTSGVLQIGNGGTGGSIAGNVTTSNLGSISFNRSNDSLVYSGTISGSGQFWQIGTGQTTLTGTNTYTGGTDITAGTLQIGNGGATGSIVSNVSIASGATLRFNRSNAITFTGGISGSGNVQKEGVGTLTYTGSAATYAGNTNVNAGTLAVNGILAGTLNVNNGATLSGTGTVGNVTINSGGILNPGNSIGTLTVNGDLNFAAGSMYKVEANSAGNSGKVVVNGTATLNGNVVALPASGGIYQVNTVYTILTSTNALSGQFNSSVSSSLAFLDASLTQDTNNVYLNLKRNSIDYADVADTGNQRSVANALQNASATGGSSADMNTIITTVNNLSADKARAAFESISGAGLVNLQRASTGFTGNFGNQLMGRLQSSGMSSTAQSINGMQLAANDRLGDLMPALAQHTRSDAPASGKFSLADGIPMDAGKRGFWLRGFGFDQDTDSDGNAAGSRIKGVGITAGFDARVSNDLVVGAALSHATSDVRASFSETGKSRGNAAAVYASYASGPWNVNGNLMLAHNANNMNRNIMVGAISRTANARFDSKTVAAYGEVSYDLPQATWTLQPLAGLGVTHNRNDGFTETGAGALNIQANAQNTTSTKTLFGARALFDLNDIQVQPRALWAHEFGDLNKAMTAQLQGSPATSFATYGVNLPRDSFITGITVAGRTNDGLSLFADVQGEFNRKQTGVALLVGLRKSW